MMFRHTLQTINNAYMHSNKRKFSRTCQTNFKSCILRIKSVFMVTSQTVNKARIINNNIIPLCQKHIFVIRICTCFNCVASKSRYLSSNYLLVSSEQGFACSEVIVNL